MCSPHMVLSYTYIPRSCPDPVFLDTHYSIHFKSFEMVIVLSFQIVCAAVDILYNLPKVVILVISNFFLRSCSQGITARSLRLGAGGTSCLSKWEQCPRQPWQQKQTAYSIDSGQHSNSDYTCVCVMETAGMWLLFLILFSSNDNHKFKHGGRLDNLNIRAFESLFAFAFPCTTC